MNTHPAYRTPKAIVDRDHVPYPEPWIVHTPECIGGQPRLNGHRLSVFHVVQSLREDWGLNDYVDDFELSERQIAHAIMYCRERRCIEDRPSRPCDGCSLKFPEGTRDPASGLHDGWVAADRLYRRFADRLELPTTYAELESID